VENKSEINFLDVGIPRYRRVTSYSGTGGRRIKENDGGGEFNVIYCKKLCKCYVI
jgi:hypothetical protein